MYIRVYYGYAYLQNKFLVFFVNIIGYLIKGIIVPCVYPIRKKRKSRLSIHHVVPKIDEKPRSGIKGRKRLSKLDRVEGPQPLVPSKFIPISALMNLSWVYLFIEFLCLSWNGMEVLIKVGDGFSVSVN